MSGEAERLAWLRLARTENVGPVTFEQLLRRFGGAQKALDALPALAARGGRIKPLSTPSLDQAKAELAAGQALGARLLIGAEADYPPMLSALDPPPPLLWALGHAHLTAKPSVAIVGARIASAAGQRFARQLAQQLGEAGFIVVSGLARGIDRAAHEGSLTSGSIAVLGGGINDLYPPENRDLYQRLAAEGLILSESPVGYRAQARDFPRRNRLISGLARAVVVVEAELKSGSLITARLAAEQGREVLAVPGSPLDPRARGTNDLIRQGAAVCEGIEDVLRALEQAPHLRERERDLFDAPLDQPALDRAAEGLRARLLALLSPTPIPRDELIRILGASPAAVLAALTELAVAGKIELLPGGLVCLA